jgi:hypothetical protein
VLKRLGAWTVRVLRRMEVPLVSTDFQSVDYYTNIKKALTAGGFMQARPRSPA